MIAICTRLVLALTLVAAVVEASLADPPPQVVVAAPGLADGVTLGSDQATVDAVVEDERARSYPAIGDRLADLQAIVARAPEPFRVDEVKGAVGYHRARTSEECLAALLAAARPEKAATSPTKTMCVANPYPTAALSLGVYFNEHGQYQQALEVLQRGLPWDLGYLAVYVETGASFNALHRPQDALDMFLAGLARPEAGAVPELKAQLLRGKGFALTELKRYDEAEQAYRDSLVLDPNHGHAERELIYVARMKAGAAAAPVVLFNNLPPATQPATQIRPAATPSSSPAGGDPGQAYPHGA